jgi:hypothetical protein
MDEVYDRYGIVLKTWFAEASEFRKNSYSVIVWGWNYHRRIIERDGLISFQVTVHGQDCDCYTCKWRVCFVKQQLADQNVQCFWTCESDDAFIVRHGWFAALAPIRRNISFISPGIAH